MSDFESKNYNNGIFIGDLIDQFRKIENISTPYSESENNYTSISITINIEEYDVNEEIYFLDNYYYDDYWNKIEQHDHLKELNVDNTELYINGNKRKYERYFIPEKEGEYIIELRFNINLTDCSYMFSGCRNIKYNMSYIFLSFLNSKINIIILLIININTK